jgi:outer membrane protein OmpA-like peptidoglycan-associated protein
MRAALVTASVVAASISAASGSATAQPISGFYVGASGGAGFLEDERVRGFVPSTATTIAPSGTRLGYKTGWVGLGSIGYALGNGVRLEIEGNARSNDLNAGAKPAGVTGRSGKESKYGAFGNVFFDLDIGSPYVFPYLGAGAGYQSVTQKYTQTGTNSAGGAVTEQFNASKGAFAYQAIAGLSFPIPGVVGLSATAEYRFMGLAGKRGYVGSLTNAGVTSTVTRKTSDDNNHDLLIGLRYAFNVVPPAAAAATQVPIAAVAPAPVAARSYLVFFDWDRSDLTERARQIIAEAAQASTRVAATRIEVAGHADRTGTADYNQGLSRRRAAQVAAELVRLGVPAAAISVSSFGDTRLLVPTASGVREPQNRRVEIVLK